MAQLAMELGPTPQQRPAVSKGGRPRKTPVGETAHQRRARFARLSPVRVTLKVKRELRNLRRRSAYQAVARAMLAVAARGDFRIVHVALERDQLHLIVEAANDRALAKGMQAFQIAAAQYLNQVVTRPDGDLRRGQVFVDRYHARILKNPAQVHRALNDVLNNWRKHGEHETPACANWQVDYFSSAPSFSGWSPPLDPARGFDGSWRYEPLPVAAPKHSLLTTGWRKAGALSPQTVPADAP